jgi:hypothetical protein
LCGAKTSGQEDFKPNAIDFKKANSQPFSQLESIWNHKFEWEASVKITFGPPPSTLTRPAALQLSM